MSRQSQNGQSKVQTEEGLFAYMKAHGGAEPDPVIVTKIEGDRVTAHRADPKTMKIIRHPSGHPLFSYTGFSANNLIT